MSLDIVGALDVAALRQALEAIVRHHPTLRTRFTSHAGDVRAHVDDDARAHVDCVDVDEAALAQLLIDEPRRRFDLSTAPMVRFTLARVSDKRHVLICVFHHIITDGVSMWRLFLSELASTYTAAKSGAPLALPTPQRSYADFVRDTIDENHGDPAAAHLAFWANELADRPAQLALPTDRQRAQRPTGDGAQVERLVPPATRRAMHILATSLGLRPTDLLLAAWATLLHRATGATDLLIGVPHANRRPEHLTIHGCIADTMVVRVDASGAPTFSELAQRISDRRWRARPHRGLSSRVLFDAVITAADAPYRPIYQVMFNHLDFSPADARLDGLTVIGRQLDTSAAAVDLALDVFERDDGLRVVLEYDRDLFDRNTALRIVARFQRLLEAGLERPQALIGDLPLLDDDERRQVLTEFQGPPLAPPEEASVGALLWSVAETFADRTALVAHGLTLSYRELFARATHVAELLRSHRVVAGDVVAVDTHDRAAAVVGILGVLGAGAAYLPLDPDVPEARSAEMMRVAGARVRLCDPGRSRRTGPTSAPQVLPLDTATSAAQTTFLGIDATPNDPAYVLFTSGSGGAPKGVLVENINVLHQLASRTALHRTPPSTFLLSYALGFDASVAGLFWTLATGGALVVLDEASRKDPVAITHAIRTHRPSHVDFVPTLYAAILDNAREGDLDSVRCVTLGGEVLDPALAQRHFARARNAALFNEYGPTELTVFSTLHEITPEASRISIGRLAPGVRGYVLDASLSPVPIGQPGELYLGGGGLARGYVGRPDLTAEVFVDDPFAMGRRLYRSGDRVRWNDDGTLDFVGRMDRQVKLRGFRVELGEVEQRISAHPDVSKSAVALIEGASGSPMLCAYWVGAAVSAEGLKEHARAHLPPHMIPSAWVHLDALPLGASGKVDLASLPPPALTHTRARRAPTTEVERRVAEIWSSVLNVPQPSLDDDFFEQGGHSLLAVNLLSRVACTFDRVIPLMMVFEQPTLGALVERLEASQPAELPLRALERIRPAGSARPVYFVGSTSQARALAHHVDPSRPVYGLNIFGLFPGEASATITLDLAEIARAYIQEIRAVQPNGPYMLLGYCAEAGLALEMAVQLGAVGEEVGFLGFIDGLPYVQLNESRPTRVMRNLITDRWQYFAQLFRRRRRVLGDWTQIMRGKLERQVAGVGGRPVSLVAQHLAWVEAYQDAMTSYEPSPYAGRLTLFLTTEVGDVDLSLLCTLARGGVELERVRGYHDTLFDAPHVRSLGDQVSRALARAEQQPTSPRPDDN